MSDKDAKDFASTSHKGLAMRVKKEILNQLKTEYAFMMGNHHIKPTPPRVGLDDENTY